MHDHFCPLVIDIHVQLTAFDYSCIAFVNPANGNQSRFCLIELCIRQRGNTYQYKDGNILFHTFILIEWHCLAK